MVRKSDQQRAGFIKYYYDRDWNDPLHYDLIINTSRLSEEMAAKLICEGGKDKNLAEQRGEAKKILSDLILRKRAEIAVLSSGKVEGHHLHVAAAEGVVTLSGHVHSEAERHEALRLAGKVEGARDVIDQLKVIEYRTVPDEH
jgi:hypothetical protein